MRPPARKKRTDPCAQATTNHDSTKDAGFLPAARGPPAGSARLPSGAGHPRDRALGYFSKKLKPQLETDPGAATLTTGASAKAQPCTIRSQSRARLLSVGDPNASQVDSELCGRAIECTLTGTFQVILHKKADLADTALEALDYR
jgi:hypothetical protein